MQNEARLPLHEVRAIFMALDKNNDGSITHSEFIKGMRWRVQGVAEQVQSRVRVRAHALE